MSALRVSDLIGKPVVTEGDGRRLGRAWDVRVRRDDRARSAPGEERWVVEGLVISRRGALERFGFVQIARNEPAGSWLSPRTVVEWDRVVRVGRDVITVRGE